MASDIDPVLREIVDMGPYPMVFATVSGAHLYGFPSRDSDWDLRGVYALPAEKVVGLERGPATMGTSGGVPGLDRELDYVTHDAEKFFELMLRRNGYVLEQILSPLVVLTTPAHGKLKALAPACITRHHAHHYRGFFGTEWKLLHKQEPPRVKPLLYCFRVLLTGRHLMETGEVEASLPRLLERYPTPGVPDLVALKAEGGEKAALAPGDLARHEAEVERARLAFEEAAAGSTLPEQPTARPALHDLLVRLRLDGPGPAVTP